MSFAKLTQSALVLFVASAAITAAHPAQTETVLYNFCSAKNCVDGNSPVSRLTSDGKGNLFGTTPGGGLGGFYGHGTVFELSPNGSGGWNETVLHRFTGKADGGNPYSSVIFDSAGNLYGTTYYGGNLACNTSAGCGVVFELKPIGAKWNETVLHKFAGGTDGSDPIAGLVIDAAGNLYGSTLFGGSSGGPDYGTVFELSRSGGGWKEQVIYIPGHLYDGPVSGLTLDAAGNIFLKASFRVIELSPDGHGGWTPTAIATIDPTGANNSYDDAFTIDSSGNLYGSATRGGTGQDYDKAGAIYKLSRGANGKWEKAILYSFSNDVDAFPWAGVVLDAAGNIYGVTVGADFGNRSKTKYQAGTVYELTANGGTYTEKVLWNFNFNNQADGIYPLGALIQDSFGNLYGTTYLGGSGNSGYGAGTVFKVTP